MRARPFDIERVPSPWREILIQEVERLKRRPDVLAIGIAGSWAFEDTWSHSDIDLEIVVRGPCGFMLRVTEREDLSVDFAFFGEDSIDQIPYETRPIYDPHGVMAQELESRNLEDVLDGMIKGGLKTCQRHLERARGSLSVDPRSTLVFLHGFAWDISEVITMAAGDHRTVKRRCSRLDRAVRRHSRRDFLSKCKQLYGFPRTLDQSRKLLSQLREGYREVWGFFRDKTLGPVYMLQQPDSELWFRNRIEPVFRKDPRDLVWIVYIEFPFVEYFLFRNLTDYERLPVDMFKEAKAFPSGPRNWVERHLWCLNLFERCSAERLLRVAESLLEDVEAFAEQKLYLDESR